MGLLSRSGNTTDDGEEYDQTFETLVVGEFRAEGSVHDPGEVEVNIDRLYRPEKVEGEPGFAVSGSVHETGHVDMNVKEELPLPTEEELEPADDGKGFTKYTRDDVRWSGGGESAVFIEELHLFPSADPRTIKAIGHRFGGYHNESDIHGAVHRPGFLTLDIEEVYIHE
jgi:hypothetical protein